MNSKMIAVVICGIMVFGMVYLVVIQNPDNEDAFDKTGTWYCYLDDKVSWESDTADPVSKSIEYDLGDEMLPFVIKERSERTFVGTFFGVEVIGALSGNSICFELKDSVNGRYWYTEGMFYETSLTLAIVYFADKEMNDVNGGAVMVYTHESTSITIMPSHPAFNKFVFDNGESTFSYIGDDNKIHTVPRDPAIMTVDKNNYGLVTVAMSEFNGKMVRNVCLTKGFAEDGTYLSITAGDTFGVGGDVTYIGGHSLSNKKLNSYLTINSTTGAAKSGILYTSYDVAYQPGESTESFDISGEWTGTGYIFDGKDTQHMKLVERSITVSGPIVSFIGSHMMDGKLMTIKWIGTIINNGIFINAEVNGHVYPMMGFAQQDKIVLCGYVEVSDGKYIGIGLELNRIK